MLSGCFDVQLIKCVGKYAFDHRRLVYTNQYDNLTPEYSGDLKSGQILKPNL